MLIARWLFGIASNPAIMSPQRPQGGNRRLQLEIYACKRLQASKRLKPMPIRDFTHNAETDD